MTMKKHLIASMAMLVSLVTIGGPAFADSSIAQSNNVTTSLTSTQLKATISEVNPFIITKKNGEVRISNSIDSLNLSPQQMNFVDQSVGAYNQVVAEGMVDITNHMGKSSEVNLSKFKSKTASSSVNGLTSSTSNAGEFGLPYSWFHASYGESVTYYYWWGDQVVLNEFATVKTEAALVTGGGGTSTIMAAAKVTNPVALAIVAYSAFYAGDMWLMDNGAGDNLQFLSNFVPLSVAGNWD